VSAGQTAARAPRRVHWHALAFGLILLAYTLLTLGVMFRSPILTFDAYLRNLDLRHTYPGYKKWISFYVVLGQRGPATLFFLPWFIWVAWRNRSPRPLILLGVALVVLNLTVGVVKIATGRLGPLYNHPVHDVFVGGNIFPSGHVSNAVVLYGLMAWIAVKHRTAGIVLAAFISVTVGLGTVYLNTHWFSDVVGGWIAGGLVLLVLPWIVPTVERSVDAVWRTVRRRLAPAAHTAEADAAAEPRTVPEPEPSPEPASNGRGPVRKWGAAQGNATSVNSVARSHNRPATLMSMEAREEPTRRGDPRNSPMPFGP
jgi:membrane-associated phospholipid phosphatase